MAMYKMIGADGQEYGLFSAEQLRQFVTEGRANAETRVQPEGGSAWLPLGSVPELAGAAAPPLTAPRPAPLPAGHVPNYLVQAILVTVFCCLPFGIAAIVFAAQVNSKLAAGDPLGALESSRKAKLWSWLAFGFGLVPVVLWLIFILIGTAGAIATGGR